MKLSFVRPFALKIASPLVLAALALAGCAPSTDEVCNHVTTKIDTKMGAPACQLKFGWMKDTKPATYRKVAPCVLKATDATSYNACLEGQ